MQKGFIVRIDTLKKTGVCLLEVIDSFKICRISEFSKYWIIFYVCCFSLE